MTRSKLAVLALIAAAALCWQIAPTGVEMAASGILHPCSSTASIATGGSCLLSCPFGDGTQLFQVDAVITLVVKAATGAPVVGVPAGDVWLLGCSGGLQLCGGSGSSSADAPTDVNGRTTISGAMAVGGCDAGVKVIFQNVVTADPLDCSQDLCLPLEVRSPDIDGNLVVNIADVGLFTLDYPSPPKAYNPCVDFNCASDLGVAVGIVDLGLFALHNFHSC